MMEQNILDGLRWEFTEELLTNNDRLSRPFDDEYWCPLSLTLLSKCLHFISDYRLIGRDRRILCDTLMGLARDAANSVKNIANGNTLLHQLAFAEKQSKSHVVVCQAVNVNKLTVEECLNEKRPLDLDWYIVHQIILPVNSLASLIDSGTYASTGAPLFTLEQLCEKVGHEGLSYLQFYVPTFQQR